MPARRLRIVPVLEIVAIVAAAVASVRWPVWALIGLLAAASVLRWSRGRSWAEPGPAVPGLAVAGIGLGVVALVGALLLAGPALERMTTRSVEWTQVAAVRGNVGMLALAAALVTARAVASELVLRRWIVDRVHDLGARPIVAVVVAAVVEGAVSGGHVASRAGAAVAGIGLGLVYVGAGRRLAPAIGCHVAFEVGALAVVWARLTA